MGPLAQTYPGSLLGQSSTLYTSPPIHLSEPWASSIELPEKEFAKALEVS